MIGARRKKTVPIRIPGSKCRTTDLGMECCSTASLSEISLSAAMLGVAAIVTPFKDM
jgi:hypothetical protein